MVCADHSFVEADLGSSGSTQLGFWFVSYKNCANLQKILSPVSISRMILVATYPDAFSSKMETTKLSETVSFIEKTFAPNVGVHMLPFFPNSGDGGFAADSIFRVDPALGNWDSLIPAFRNRAYFIDGIYNHVGNASVFAESLFADPVNASTMFHAFPSIPPLISPQSPRGQRMLVDEPIGEEVWQVWRTFNEFAIDLNLDNPAIAAVVEEHMRFIRSLGVRGVRLDAISYYGKEFGDAPRHTPSSHRLARLVADRCAANGLEIIAQLDCDMPALEYFDDSKDLNVALIDYGFCPKLLYGLISDDFSFLFEHIQTHRGNGQRLIRAPRTHDGVLLRSKSIDQEFIEVFWERAEQNQYLCRVIDTPYEINDPLPSILKNGRDEDFQSRLMLAIAVTHITADICYLYLPAILGFAPNDTPSTDEDPREFNRKRIPDDFVASDSNSSRIQTVANLVNTLANLRTISAKDRVAQNVQVRQQSNIVFSLDSDVLGQSLVFNTTNSHVTCPEAEGYILASSGVQDGQLGPYGFMLIERESA